MCVEIMDTRSTHMKPDCLLRKTMKRVSKPRWRLLRRYAEADEASQPCRAAAAAVVAVARATDRKCFHREQKRAQVLRDVCKRENAESAACESRHPLGAMAPENTTQYLMGNVYEDMKTRGDTQSLPVCNEMCARLYSESLSPRSVYAALDSGYESCLAFQQRDFEEAFELCW